MQIKIFIKLFRKMGDYCYEDKLVANGFPLNGLTLYCFPFVRDVQHRIAPGNCAINSSLSNTSTARMYS